MEKMMNINILRYYSHHVILKCTMMQRMAVINSGTPARCCDSRKEDIMGRKVETSSVGL